MSQHTYRTTLQDGREVEVLAGWDRPLQGYFMMVELLDETDEENPYLYDNLDQEESHPKNFQTFVDAARNLGIELPQQMVAEITADGESDTGNKYVSHAMIDGHYHRNGVKAN